MADYVKISKLIKS